jgi:O-antigen ligase
MAFLTWDFTGDYLVAAQDRLIRGMNPKILAIDSSTQWRIEETRYAVRSFLRQPLFGIGLGNPYRPPLQWEPAWSAENIQWYIHNAYLWVLVDAGLIGFIPFICFYALGVLRGLRFWRSIGDSRFRVTVLGFTLGVLGQAISNIVTPNFFQNWVLVIFPILLGMNEVIFRKQNEGEMC